VKFLLKHSLLDNATLDLKFKIGINRQEFLTVNRTINHSTSTATILCHNKWNCRRYRRDSRGRRRPCHRERCICSRTDQRTACGCRSEHRDY